MKSIELLHGKLQTAPTLLPVEEELRWMADLMALRPEEIERDKDLFFEVLERVEEAHTIGCGYMSREPEAIEAFERFASFIEGLVSRFPGRKALLVIMVDNFRLRLP